MTPLDKVSTHPMDKKIPPQVFFPCSFDDVEKMIEVLKTHRPIIVNVKNLAMNDRYRIIDFLSGYVFALNGRREKLEAVIFHFSL